MIRIIRKMHKEKRDGDHLPELKDLVIWGHDERRLGCCNRDMIIKVLPPLPLRA